MGRKSTGEYPANWTEISQAVKDAAGWRCIRCNHPHDIDAGKMLTVHHLDLNKSNCAWWNLAALSQDCHLRIQGKVIMERIWVFEHSEWFKPYVSGYYYAQMARRNGYAVPTDYYESLVWFPRALAADRAAIMIAYGQGLVSA